MTESGGVIPLVVAIRVCPVYLVENINGSTISTVLLRHIVSDGMKLGKKNNYIILQTVPEKEEEIIGSSRFLEIDQKALKFELGTGRILPGLRMTV